MALRSWVESQVATVQSCDVTRDVTYYPDYYHYESKSPYAYSTDTWPPVAYPYYDHGTLLTSQPRVTQGYPHEHVAKEEPQSRDSDSRPDYYNQGIHPIDRHQVAAGVKIETSSPSQVTSTTACTTYDVTAGPHVDCRDTSGENTLITSDANKGLLSKIQSAYNGHNRDCPAEAHRQVTVHRPQPYRPVPVTSGESFTPSSGKLIKLFTMINMNYM